MQETPEFWMPPSGQGSEATSTSGTGNGSSTGSRELSSNGNGSSNGSSAGDGTRGDASLTAEHGGIGSARSTPRRRFGWSHLAIVGALCLLLGAAVPAGYQAVQRSAVDAQVERLRSVATDYLQAIADGEAQRATALVPLAGTAEAAPANVLAAAEPIAHPEVDLVRIEGDTGSVQVRFDVGSRESVHLLGAERVDGDWRLTTSLAETPRVELYPGYGGPQIAGVEIGRPAPLQLYPGAYTLDVVTDATTQIGGDSFVVDGDPATLTLIPTTVQTSPLLVERASEIALTHAEQCRSSGVCDWPPSATLSLDAEPQVGNLASTGFVELVVPIDATSGSFNQHFQVTVQVVLDAQGEISGATCSQPMAPEADPVPCGP